MGREDEGEIKNIKSKSPAERKHEEAEEFGLEAPLTQFEDLWDVERGVKEMEEWPEKVAGYKELIFYLFFYTIFCIVLVLQTNPSECYAVNSSLGNLVAGYDTVALQTDWWTYTQNLMTVIFTPTWYNGDRYTSDYSGYIQSYNKLVGGVLIIQNRGLEVNCSTSLYNAFYGDCHAETEDTGNFTTLSASLPMVYPYDPVQGGYSTFFSVALTQQQVLTQLQNLQQSLWLDKNTRHISIKFAIYNGEYRIFSFAAVTMTFGVGGVMFGNNKANVQSARMELYTNADDYARLVLEIIFMYMASWLFSDEMIDLFQTVFLGPEDAPSSYNHSIVNGLKTYFSSAWNYLDMTNHALVMVYIALRIGYVIYVYQNPIQLPTNQYQTILEDVASLQASLQLFIALLILVKTLHLFKYFAFQPRMNILSSTLERALPDLFHFFILFGCIFLSYVVMALLLFGPYLEGYSSFGLIAQTLGEFLLGNADFESIHGVNPLMATLLFWTYHLLVLFVLLNVFLAILIDSYSEAKAESKEAPGIPDDIGRWALLTFSKKPKGASTFPLHEALLFFKKKGVKNIETIDIVWFMKEKYGIEDEEFIAKNEGMLRAMQCVVKEDDRPDAGNAEINQLMQAAWQTYDKDGNGFLDRSEFQAFLNDAPVRIGPEQKDRLDILLKEGDTNGDGLISYDEFVPIFHSVILEGLAMQAKKDMEAARAKAGQK